MKNSLRVMFHELEMCQKHGICIEGDAVCASTITGWPHVPIIMSRWFQPLVSFLKKLMINVRVALPQDRLIQNDKIDKTKLTK